MAQLPNNVLLNFKLKLRRFKNTGDGGKDPFLLQVLGVWRQLVDVSFRAITGVTPGDQAEAFDLLLTDGNHKIMVVLNPTCNMPVHTGQVIAGSVIELTLSDIDLHFNETDLSAFSLIIINRLQAYGTQPLQLNPETVPFSSQISDKHKVLLPLASDRKSHLSLWCAEDPCGPSWKTEVELQTTPVNFAHTTTLQRVAAQRKAFPCAGQSLLVKVIHKARLRHYGRPVKKDAYPFQAFFEIADRTGVASAVLWASMCTDLYCSLTEGDVILLNNYKVRERYQQMSRPTMRYENLDRFDIEVNLNKLDQAQTVKVVPPDQVNAAWDLPALSPLFITRDRLGSLPDEFNCDVAGVVTYVGRYERHRKPGPGCDTWLGRWVHLHDDTSPLPIRILVFASSQPAVHRSIHPGGVCVMTQLRIRHNLNQLVTSRVKRTLYLTTTNESQVYLHDDHTTAPYSEHTFLTRLTRWRQSVDCAEALSWRRVCGYYSYPPLPMSLPDYKDSFRDPVDFQLTSMEEVARLAGELRLRETRRVVVQGFIMRVQFVPTAEQQYSPRRSKRKPGVQSNDGDTLVKRGKTGRQGNASPEERSASRLQKRLYESPDAVGVQSRCLDDVTVTGTGIPSPSFLMRAYDDSKQAAIMDALNFPENPSGTEWIQQPLADCPVVGSCGYFKLTVSGLNHNHVLYTLFPAPARLSRHVTLLHMLSTERFDWSTDCAGCPTDVAIISLLKSVSNDQRLVFVLDIYNPRGQEVELVINRAFPVGDPTT